ncbi:MAG: hypothetical protein JNM36_00200 [Chitinophagales bacterium]|nr:hypothetical protein [Chitinophagales bacterium]
MLPKPNPQSQRRAAQHPCSRSQQLKQEKIDHIMEGLKYIGRQINLKTIRNFILDEGISEADIIFLNPKNFDDVLLEYREVYREGVIMPFYLLGILITEGKHDEIPVGRVLLKKGINNSSRDNSENDNEYYNGEEIFRCGYCGNVVDFDGSELEPYERNRKIKILEKFGSEVIVHPRHGRCCREQWNK